MLDIRGRWLAGLCPCCGGPLDDDAQPVAEGVMMCEYCLHREHDAADVLPTLLDRVVGR